MDVSDYPKRSGGRYNNRDASSGMNTIMRAPSFEAALLNQIPEAVVGTDSFFNIQFINHAAEELFQVRNADVLGHPLELLFSSLLQEHLYASWLDELKQHSCSHIHIPLERENKLMEWVASAVLEARGGTGGYFFRCQKITDKTEAAGGIDRGPFVSEEVLSVPFANEDFRQLADLMPQLVWTATGDGVVDYYNIRYKEFDGIAPEEGHSWEWSPVLHPEDIEPTIQAWQNALATGEMYQIEHRARMSDGTYRWQLSRGVPIRNQKGKVVRWYGTATDIHDHKMAAEARRESEERFRTLVDSMEDIVFTLDTRSLISGIYGRWFEKQGIDTTKMLGGTVGEAAGSAEGVLHEEASKQALAGRQVVYEWNTVLFNRKVYFHFRLSPIRDADGNVTGVVGVGRDVTGLKTAEKTLEEYTLKLERSNQELQDFAYVASHDLQEPLRKIKSFGEALKLKAGDKIDPESQEYLERMRSAAERMQRMIRDLLELSRVHTHTRPFSIVDLKQISTEVVADLEALLDQTGGGVKIGDLPELEADPVQMHQLLQNLIVNGLKYHRKNIPPVVEVHGEVYFDKGSGQKMASIRVKDNGIGFDESRADYIFQPFSRLHGRHEYGGTGMGLTICSKIVQRHSGSITAHSSVGEGSTFVIKLPLIQPAF